MPEGTEILTTALGAETLMMVITVTVGGFQMIKSWIPSKFKMVAASLFGMAVIAVAMFAPPAAMLILFGGTITGGVALAKKK